LVEDSHSNGVWRTIERASGVTQQFLENAAHNPDDMSFGLGSAAVYGALWGALGSAVAESIYFKQATGHAVRSMGQASVEMGAMVYGAVAAGKLSGCLMRECRSAFGDTAIASSPVFGRQHIHEGHLGVSAIGDASDDHQESEEVSTRQYMQVDEREIRYGKYYPAQGAPQKRIPLGRTSSLDEQQARIALDDIVAALNRTPAHAFGVEPVRRFVEQVYIPQKYENGDWRKATGQEAEYLF
jgi:hypothetical protein